jgi:hypothetical protein
MSDKIGRRVIVSIDDVQYASYTVDQGRVRPTGFRIDFDVSRSIKAEPDKCNVVVYNPPLEAVERVLLSKKRARVVLRAGYDTPPAVIAIGSSVKDGVEFEYRPPERQLKIQFADGLRRFQMDRVAISFKGRTTMADVLGAVVGKVGLGVATLDLDAARGVELPNGFVAQGPLRKVLDDIARACSADWTIQDDKLVFLGTKAAAFEPGTGPAFTFDDGTLYDAPSPRKGGAWTFKTRFEPRLKPGARFFVDPGRSLGRGYYKAVSVKLTGSSYSGDFSCVIEAKPFEVEVRRGR